MAEAPLIEPVSWQSRLERARGIGYTEVDGTPVLVDSGSGETIELTPYWAAVWANLDARPVAEVLEVDPTVISGVDGRNLIEVLRRLKARGLIVDHDPAAARVGHDPFATGGHAKRAEVRIAGLLEDTDNSRTLVIDRQATEQVTVRVEVSDAVVKVSHRGRIRHRPIPEIQVVDNRLQLADNAVARFAVIVAAVVDRSVLEEPGITDLLAGLAESSGSRISNDGS